MSKTVVTLMLVWAALIMLGGLIQSTRDEGISTATKMFFLFGTLTEILALILIWQ